MPNLAELIKKAALDAYQASAPPALLFGVVTEPEPLLIELEPKLVLAKEQLIFSSLVSAKDLQKDQQLIILQAAGGQLFLVLDYLQAPDEASDEA